MKILKVVHRLYDRDYWNRHVTVRPVTTEQTISIQVLPVVDDITVEAIRMAQLKKIQR